MQAPYGVRGCSRTRLMLFDVLCRCTESVGRPQKRRHRETSERWLPRLCLWKRPERTPALWIRVRDFCATQWMGSSRCALQLQNRTKRCAQLFGSHHSPQRKFCWTDRSRSVFNTNSGHHSAPPIPQNAVLRCGHQCSAHLIGIHKIWYSTYGWKIFPHRFCNKLSWSHEIGKLLTLNVTPVIRTLLYYWQWTSFCLWNLDWGNLCGINFLLRHYTEKNL